jgi:hypothetical protein
VDAGALARGEKGLLKVSGLGEVRLAAAVLGLGWLGLEVGAPALGGVGLEVGAPALGEVGLEATVLGLGGVALGVEEGMTLGVLGREISACLPIALRSRFLAVSFSPLRLL